MGGCQHVRKRLIYGYLDMDFTNFSLLRLFALASGHSTTFDRIFKHGFSSTRSLLTIKHRTTRPMILVVQKYRSLEFVKHNWGRSIAINQFFLIDTTLYVVRIALANKILLNVLLLLNSIPVRVLYLSFLLYTYVTRVDVLYQRKQESRLFHKSAKSRSTDIPFLPFFLSLSTPCS